MTKSAVSKNNRLCFTFKAVDASSRELISSWMTQGHVKEWIYGECLKRTLDDLDAFFSRTSFFQHWLAAKTDSKTCLGIPFGYLLTSEVHRDGDDEYARFCREGNTAITLDVLIGNPQFLGRGFGHKMIQAFLLSQFPQVHEVLIDPDVMNRRAIHVYEKVGFSIVDEFIPTQSARLHYMMRLDMRELKNRIDDA